MTVSESARYRSTTLKKKENQMSKKHSRLKFVNVNVYNTNRLDNKIAYYLGRILVIFVLFLVASFLFLSLIIRVYVSGRRRGLGPRDAGSIPATLTL